MDKPVEPTMKTELVNQLATLLVDDPAAVMKLLLELVQKAMLVSIMNQVKASIDSHISIIEQELLQGSCMQVGTNQGANPNPEGGAQPLNTQ